jgi:hypothetical protein
VALPQSIAASDRFTSDNLHKEAIKLLKPPLKEYLQSHSFYYVEEHTLIKASQLQTHVCNNGGRYNYSGVILYYKRCL